MITENKVNFASNVMVLDANLLNVYVANAREVLSQRIGRTLPKIDLVGWLEYLCLDANIRGEQNEIQVLLVHEQGVKVLTSCEPSMLSELNGKACKSALGEISFTTINPEGMAQTSSLFVDLMTLAIESDDTRNVLLAPLSFVYAEELEERLNDIKKEKGDALCKKVTYFTLQPTERPLPVSCDLMTYSLIKAFGINPQELR